MKEGVNDAIVRFNRWLKLAGRSLPVVYRQSKNYIDQVALKFTQRKISSRGSGWLGLEISGHLPKTRNWTEGYIASFSGHSGWKRRYFGVGRHLQNLSIGITDDELESLRQKLIAKKADVSKRNQILEAKIIEVDNLNNQQDHKAEEDSKWNDLLNRVSSAAGSVGDAVTSHVPSLQTLPYRRTPRNLTEDRLGNSSRSPNESSLGLNSETELTDTQNLEITRKLIRALDEPMARSLKDPSCCIKPLERLCIHLHKVPWTAGAATKDAAVSKILLLRHNCDESDGISLLIQEALGLLGFHDPPSARGPRILSIDGGGTRGIIALKMLSALEKGTGQPIHKLFDLICGVSTGAILAAFLAFKKMPIKDVEKLYLDFSVQIFKQNRLYGAKRMVVSQSYYDTLFYEQLLQELCGKYASQASMNDFYRSKDTPKVAIVATEVSEDRVSPYVFRSYQLPRKTHTSYNGSSRHHVWAALRASTAAPGYFDNFILDDMVFHDGGMLVNNPTQIAIHEAHKIWPDYPLQSVISLGLGRTDNFMKGENKKKAPGPHYLTISEKFARIVDSATDTELVHLSLLDLMTERGVYYRFNPYLKEFTYLDDTRAEQFNMMKEYSHMYIRRNQRKFSDACYQLTKGKGPHHNLKDYLKLRRELLKAQYF